MPLPGNSEKSLPLKFFLGQGFGATGSFVLDRLSDSLSSVTTSHLRMLWFRTCLQLQM